MSSLLSLQRTLRDCSRRHFLIMTTTTTTTTTTNFSSSTSSPLSLFRPSSLFESALVKSNDQYPSIRSFSSFPGGSSNSNDGPPRMNPAYQVYGEDAALTIKAIIPGFKVFGKSVVQDKSRKGRLLFEWTPRNSQGTQFD
jgi:hypothetical protein